MKVEFLGCVLAGCLFGCMGQIDPASFANYSARVEQVAEISTIIRPDNWVVLRPSIGKIFFLSNGEDLGTFDFEPPFTLGAMSAINKVAKLVDGAAHVELGDYLLVGLRQCCEAYQASESIGCVVSVGSHNTGQLVAQAMLPEARMTRGIILASTELAAFQTEQPPGLAFFDLTKLPNEVPFLGFADDQAFQGVLGGALYERDGALQGLVVGVDRLVPFVVEPGLGYRVTLGEPTKLREPGDSHHGKANLVYANVVRFGLLALVTDAGEKLFTVDLSDPMQPVVLKRVGGFAQAQMIAKMPDTNFAVLANGIGGVAFVNIEDPADPVLLNVSRVGNSRALATYGPYVYSAGGLVLKVLKVLTPGEY